MDNYNQIELKLDSHTNSYHLYSNGKLVGFARDLKEAVKIAQKLRVEQKRRVNTKTVEAFRNQNGTYEIYSFGEKITTAETIEDVVSYVKEILESSRRTVCCF